MRIRRLLHSDRGWRFTLLTILPGLFGAGCGTEPYPFLEAYSWKGTTSNIIGCPMLSLPSLNGKAPFVYNEDYWLSANESRQTIVGFSDRTIATTLLLIWHVPVARQRRYLVATTDGSLKAWLVRLKPSEFPHGYEHRVLTRSVPEWNFPDMARLRALAQEPPRHNPDVDTEIPLDGSACITMSDAGKVATLKLSLRSHAEVPLYAACLAYQTDVDKHLESTHPELLGQAERWQKCLLEHHSGFVVIDGVFRRFGMYSSWWFI